MLENSESILGPFKKSHFYQCPPYHDVLALFCFGTLRVESKGSERLESSSSVWVGAEDPLGYCCLLCCSLYPVALGKGKVGRVASTVVELR
jgi:hypothetical protein